MKEREQLIQLLVGLNDVYKGFLVNILISRPLTNVSEVYYMLLQEEHQREMSSETPFLPQSAALNSSYSLCSSNQESMGFFGKNRVAPMLAKIILVDIMEALVVIIAATLCKDLELMEVLEGMVGTWLLEGLLFSMTTVRCLVILSKNATRYTTIHLATGYIKARGLQPL